jgi:pyruvate dehydrogenase E1 component alpha subunit
VHTTADDPTKYRSNEEVAEWERKDPLTRFSGYLKKKGLLDEGVEAQVDEEIARAVQRFEAVGAPDPLVMFDHAYATPPAHIAVQRDALASRLSDGQARTAGEGHPSPPMRGQRTTRR